MQTTEKTETVNYRLKQIAKLNNGDFNYPPTIKIHGGKSGATNCLDISKDEFIRICQVLTEVRKEG
jgi:hypothetical protein